MKDDYISKEEVTTTFAIWLARKFLPHNFSMWREVVELVLKDVRFVQSERWIQCSERLPENEHEVMVTVEVRPIGCKPRRRVIKAFYTDGKHTDADSAYTWYELEEPDSDDDGNIIIPEGWWEAVDYSDEFNMIDDFVVAWREPPEPWEGGQDEK